MRQAIDILYKGRPSRFSLTSIDRKCQHGCKRRVALDEQGHECASALLTRDGRFLLPAGSTADIYIDANGDTVKKSELSAVDSDGHPLATLPATSDRPQTLEGPAAVDEFLGHVATKVYVLEGEGVDPVFAKALRAGAIFRIPFRPRATHHETPAFLLVNDHGVFMAQTEPCGFDFVGLEQTLTDADRQDEEASTFDDDGEFSFDLDREAEHAAA